MGEGVRMVAKKFPLGMTVRDLRDLVNELPLVDRYGDDAEVFMKTGRNLSGPVRTVWPLNSADVLLDFK